jgi:hypothetical protein
MKEMNSCYSPLMIFFNRFNSSSISSRKELSPPPGFGAVMEATGPGELTAAGGCGGDPAAGDTGAVGGPGLLTNVGDCVTPGLGAAGGGPPEVGGNFGAGGRLARGVPAVGAFGGPLDDGALGGPALPVFLGGPPELGIAGATGAAGTVVIGGAAEIGGAGPPPLSKLNKVLAAAVFAEVSIGETSFVEDELSVNISSSIVTSFKSFKALFKDLIKSFTPLTVSSRSSDKEVNPFFIKFMTRSSFFCSFDTKKNQFLYFFLKSRLYYTYSDNCIILIYIFIFIFL